MSKTIVVDSTKTINQEVQTQTLVTLASSIAHETKNCLAAISICVELSEIQLSNIRERIKAANYLIGNLQLQIKGIIADKPNEKDFKQYSMVKNIEEALEHYPFKKGERELITLDIEQDFEYLGNPVLTNHILFNLIKNALRAISNASRGTITIALKPAERCNNNKLIFRDTATGISKDFLPKMFKLFESQSIAQGGTGVGLAFCKLIMQSYGGDIVCNSVKGKYTEFVLSFPKVDKQK